MGKDSDIKVEALRPQNSKGKCELVVELKKGNLHIESRRLNSAKLGEECDAGFAVTMPPRVILEVVTGSGHIAADGLRNGAKLRAGSGNVRLKQVAGKVYVLTGSGDVSATTPAKLLDIRTGSGNVSATWSGKAGSVTIVTGSGNVSLTLDKSAVASFNLTTGSGKIANALPSRPGAPLLVKAATGSGNVTITTP